ncbi:MAG: hypothetical protein NZ807_08330 [Dehalococcoidia bacterium]|nr:hypothetical protein [Dehalococcoidia bacterium]
MAISSEMLNFEYFASVGLDQPPMFRLAADGILGVALLHLGHLILGFSFMPWRTI